MEEDRTRRHEVDRSALLPELRRMLDAADALGAKPVEAQTPQEARASSEIRIAGQWGEKDPVKSIDTFSIPGAIPGGADGGIAGSEVRIPVRLYRFPDTSRTILYFHGGGWVVGSLETHDGALRALSLAARCNILAVEYRKAPEAPFPAGLDDADAALGWLRASADRLALDAAQVILAGDSAGASIAAALAVRARHRAIPFRGQVLVYPATDLAASSASRETFATGYSLSKTSLDWFARHYLSGGVPADNPEISPLRMKDLSNLRPTLLVTADHDPLRDEGRAYAQALIGAGNDVTYIEWGGTVHGFMMMDKFTPAARQLIGTIAEWCNSVWNR